MLGVGVGGGCGWWWVWVSIMRLMCKPICYIEITDRVLSLGTAKL